MANRATAEATQAGRAFGATNRAADVANRAIAATSRASRSTGSAWFMAKTCRSTSTTTFPTRSYGAPKTSRTKIWP